MKTYFDDFDRELSQGLKETANSIIPPDKDQVWSDISREIESINNKTNISIFKKLAAAAAILMVLLTGLLAVGDNALADFRFFRAIKSVINNVVSISGVTQTNNSIPVIDNTNIEQNGNNKDLYSLEEARHLLDYEIVLPGYIPATYTLYGIYIRGLDSLSPAELHYVDSIGNELIIDENLIDQPTSFSYNFRSNEAESSTVKINEYEATLIYFEKTGLRKLLWQTPDRYYIISASLSEEDILKLAKSLGK